MSSTTTRPAANAEVGSSGAGTTNLGVPHAGERAPLGRTGSYMTMDATSMPGAGRSPSHQQLLRRGSVTAPAIKSLLASRDATPRASSISTTPPGAGIGQTVPETPKAGVRLDAAQAAMAVQRQQPHLDASDRDPALRERQHLSRSQHTPGFEYLMRTQDHAEVERLRSTLFPALAHSLEAVLQEAVASTIRAELQQAERRVVAELHSKPPPAAPVPVRTTTPPAALSHQISLEGATDVRSAVQSVVGGNASTTDASSRVRSGATSVGTASPAPPPFSSQLTPPRSPSGGKPNAAAPHAGSPLDEPPRPSTAPPTSAVPVQLLEKAGLEAARREYVALSSAPTHPILAPGAAAAEARRATVRAALEKVNQHPPPSPKPPAVAAGRQQQQQQQPQLDGTAGGNSTVSTATAETSRLEATGGSVVPTPRHLQRVPSRKGSTIAADDPQQRRRVSHGSMRAGTTSHVASRLSSVHSASNLEGLAMTDSFNPPFVGQTQQQAQPSGAALQRSTSLRSRPLLPVGDLAPNSQASSAALAHVTSMATLVTDSSVATPAALPYSPSGSAPPQQPAASNVGRAHLPADSGADSSSCGGEEPELPRFPGYLSEHPILLLARELKKRAGGHDKGFDLPSDEHAARRQVRKAREAAATQSKPWQRGGSATTTTQQSSTVDGFSLPVPYVDADDEDEDAAAPPMDETQKPVLSSTQTAQASASNGKGNRSSAVRRATSNVKSPVVTSMKLQAGSSSMNAAPPLSLAPAAMS